jgi:hypothetical protein
MGWQHVSIFFLAQLKLPLQNKKKENPKQSVPITTAVVSWNLHQDEVYTIM